MFITVSVHKYSQLFRLASLAAHPSSSPFWHCVHHPTDIHHSFRPLIFITVSARFARRSSKVISVLFRFVPRSSTRIFFSRKPLRRGSSLQWLSLFTLASVCAPVPAGFVPRSLFGALPVHFAIKSKDFQSFSVLQTRTIENGMCSRFGLAISFVFAVLAIFAAILQPSRDYVSLSCLILAPSRPFSLQFCSRPGPSRHSAAVS
jgi:hypothetical protein